MTVVLDLFILILGFLLLVKGADYFVDGAAGIADKLKIPQIVIGLTIVAFGTSAPEAAISISAALHGSAAISIGNILGSNILNIMLILGITACIREIPVDRGTVRIDLPFATGISVLLVILGSVLGKLNFICGIILLTLLALYFVHLLKVSKEKRQESKSEDEPVHKTLTLVLFTVFGLAAVVIGSQLTIDSATSLARTIGISERIIALTIIAFGTSLPELITSVSAARKGKSDIAVGNIVGSNIFNILFVLGTASLIEPIPFSGEFILDGIIASAASLLLLLFVFRSKKLTRPAGIAMLLLYAVYFVFMIL